MPERALAAAALAEIHAEEDAAQRNAERSADPHSPWDIADGWRLNGDSLARFVFLEGEARRELLVHFTPAGLSLEIAGTRLALSGTRLADGSLRVALDGNAYPARVVRHGSERHIFVAGRAYRLALAGDAPQADAAAESGSLAAPMPGKVVAVLVAVGAKVTKGAPLVVLEAMKMEHQIVAPHDGRVAELFFKPGDPVGEGALLLRMESE